MSSEYKVENDEYYKSFAFQTSRNEKTTEHYKKVLRKFCRATSKTLTEIITTCIDEQSIVTTVKLEPDENGNERRKEIKFNIDSKDAAINKFLNQFEDYCYKKNNKQITIENQTDMVRSVLHENGVELPKRKRYEDDSRDWYLPSKLDFNYLLQDASLVHVSLANMLSSSGMRVSDALSKSIGDFMKATSDYHDFVDVEEFIDNAPDDMIAQWVFEPQKTIRHHVKCITFSSAHTSNLILQNLRHVKNHYIPYKNRTEGLNLSISKKDPLFGSRKKKYKSPLTGKGVASYWIEKNKKFRVWKINQIKQQIENGEISKEDYDEAVSRIPHFHPHVCRKFFCTTVSNNCGDIRVCALLEGHSDGLPNDSSYIKKSVEDIKEIYINNIHDALSLDNVETKIISDKETERLNAEIESLKAENKKIKEENSKKDQEINIMKQEHQEEIDGLKSSIGNIEKQMADFSIVRSRSNIEKTIFDYINSKKDNIFIEKDIVNNSKKFVLINKIAYDIAIEEESKFRADDEYLESLIQRAIVKYTLNPDINQFKKETLSHDELEMLNEYVDLFTELWELIQSDDTLWSMVKNDQIKLKNIITHVIKKNVDNIDNLTDDDKKNMVQDVIMEYLTVD